MHGCEPTGTRWRLRCRTSRPWTVESWRPSGRRPRRPSGSKGASALQHLAAMQLQAFSQVRNDCVLPLKTLGLGRSRTVNLQITQRWQWMSALLNDEAAWLIWLKA